LFELLLGLLNIINVFHFLNGLL